MRLLLLVFCFAAASAVDPKVTIFSVPDIHVKSVSVDSVETLPVVYDGGVRFSVRDIYDRPVVVIAKNDRDQDKFVSCVLEDGLYTLVDTPCFEYVRSNFNETEDNFGFLFYPSLVPHVENVFPFNSIAISRILIPQGVKLSNVDRLSSIYNFPWLLLSDKTEFETEHKTTLKEVGDIKVLDGSVQILRDVPILIPTTFV